jgi:leucyl-tRNA synthetase
MVSFNNSIDLQKYNMIKKFEYDFKKIENKWSKIFEEYSVSNDEILNNSSKKYYVLEMLPYPSGKLHMGHIRNYTLGDVVARFKRMSGAVVIHPMGWDSFGMPAENAAIQSGEHPKIWTESNISSMKKQLKSIGCMYDWKRELGTHEQDYYFQEQKIFLEMFKNGLAYRKKSYVNWDPIDQTVLANEQVIDGRGWRSGAVVEKKTLEQWSIKITAYAEELLSGLKDLEGYWPSNVLKMQENWIGKSEGAVINFKVVDEDRFVRVYTTRPDTLFGASFVAISADHEISIELAKTSSEISNFLDDCKKAPTTEEYIANMEKLGVYTGLQVVHPFVPSLQIPVYIANFVLSEYGTGAVFGCPAHDVRDFEFATKYKLKINGVIQSESNDEHLPYTGDGTLINSEFLNGMDTNSAKAASIRRLEEIGAGQGRVTYRLRDWLVSRQRYWGCPVPIVHCPNCGLVPAKLPVPLPNDVNFGSSGSPLENHQTWKNVKCPKCGGEAIMDTDTLDTFFESSWYFLRYLDVNSNDPINKIVSDVALPIDMYIGGVEHAVLHLLYARFFTLALRDMGYINSSIPFGRLMTQGMVCHKTFKNTDGEWVYPDEITKLSDGRMYDLNKKEVFEHSFEKMSKSKKNVISPQKLIESHGADAVRLFIISDTPPEKDFYWNTDALDGASRFIQRVWNLFNSILEDGRVGANSLFKKTHVYLKKITSSIESMAFNKSVALIREFFNEIENVADSESQESLKFAMKSLIKVMYPITPHVCCEMWSRLGEGGELCESSWPEIDEELAAADVVVVAVQVNGKLRGTIEVEPDSDESTLETNALELLKDSIDRSSVKKIVIVKNRVVNIVI